MVLLLEESDHFCRGRQKEVDPCVVPDRDASDQTMGVALSKLNDLSGRNRSPEKKSGGSSGN